MKVRTTFTLEWFGTLPFAQRTRGHTGLNPLMGTMPGYMELKPRQRR